MQEITATAETSGRNGGIAHAIKGKQDAGSPQNEAGGTFRDTFDSFNQADDSAQATANVQPPAGEGGNELPPAHQQHDATVTAAAGDSDGADLSMMPHLPIDDMVIEMVASGQGDADAPGQQVILTRLPQQALAPGAQAGMPAANAENGQLIPGLQTGTIDAGTAQRSLALNETTPGDDVKIIEPGSALNRPVNAANRGDTLQQALTASSAGSEMKQGDSSQMLNMQMGADSDSGQPGSRQGLLAAQLLNAGSINTSNMTADSAPMFSGLLNASASQSSQPPLLQATTSPLMQPTITEAFGSANWSQGLGKQVMLMINQSVQSAELRMNPAHLGPVEVRIDMDDDQVSIAMSSRHAVVREAMELAMPKLRDMLEQNGLNLAGADVSQHSFAEQDARAEAGADEHGAHPHAGAQAGGVAEEASGPETQASGLTVHDISSMVDYYI